MDTNAAAIALISDSHVDKAYSLMNLENQINRLLSVSS
jgi:hypothetical protein